MSQGCWTHTRHGSDAHEPLQFASDLREFRHIDTFMDKYGLELDGKIRPDYSVQSYAEVSKDGIGDALIALYINKVSHLHPTFHSNVKLD